MVLTTKRKRSRIRFRGFASMPKDKVIMSARIGGRVRAVQLGSEGFAALGRKGGINRALQIGRQGLVELGRRGGARKHRLTDEELSQAAELEALAVVEELEGIEKIKEEAILSTD